VFQQYDNMFWQAAIPAADLSAWNLGARYSPAQTVGFGLTQFTVPLALVMMPRLARSAAMGEASNSLKLTVLCTAAMGGGAALACTILPRLPLQVMFFNKPENWAAAPLVPWFAWAMTFFTLANVFLNDLFARRRFGVVAVIVVPFTTVTLVAKVPPMVTTEEPVKLVPVIVTLAPPTVLPLEGEIPVTVGAGAPPLPAAPA
jgi:peptidoglycan biosynthesis protein MviN/MurJ (putative lipid II flippase)